MGLLELLRLRPQKPDVQDLYIVIVAQARRPQFYEHLGVPDTANGRFELIVLHAYFVMRRLKEIGHPGTAISQALFDHMFADMDRNLREMGVGDLGVGRKIKAMATAYYGRLKAYDEGLAQGPEILQSALQRNLFADVKPSEAQLAAMAAYITDCAAKSAVWSLQAIAAGNFECGPLPSLSGDAVAT